MIMKIFGSSFPSISKNKQLVSISTKECSGFCIIKDLMITKTKRCLEENPMKNIKLTC